MASQPCGGTMPIKPTQCMHSQLYRAIIEIMSPTYVLVILLNTKRPEFEKPRSMPHLFLVQILLDVNKITMTSWGELFS